MSEPTYLAIEAAQLALRAEACKGWRWMPGMLSAHGDRYEEGDGPWLLGHCPDLTDPATLGCLLALVREAHGPWVTVAGGPGAWTVREYCSIGVVGGANRLRGVDDYTTEAEALVAALEAAP